MTDTREAAYTEDADRAAGCGCWADMQTDPECPLHGRLEFRVAAPPSAPPVGEDTDAD